MTHEITRTSGLFVIHFLALEDSNPEKDGMDFITDAYCRAVNFAYDYDGSRFHNKSYGGGVSFASMEQLNACLEASKANRCNDCNCLATERNEADHCDYCDNKAVVSKFIDENTNHEYDIEALTADIKNNNFNIQHDDVENYRFETIIFNSLVNGQFTQAKRQCQSCGADYDSELAKFKQSN